MKPENRPHAAAQACPLAGPAAGRDAGGDFSLAGYALLLQHHWFWLAVTLGIGVWSGWHTAIDRPYYEPPAEP